MMSEHTVQFYLVFNDPSPLAGWGTPFLGGWNAAPPLSWMGYPYLS